MRAVEGLPVWERLTNPLAKALDRAFGCRHSNLSRVFTMEGRSYRVCCECGASFDYSLEKMEGVSRSESEPPLEHLQTRHT